MKHQRVISTLFFLYAFVFVIGCSTTGQLNRKIDKAKVTVYQNSDRFADVFATLYPVKDSVSTPVITYAKADNVDLTSYINDLATAAADTSNKEIILDLQERIRQMQKTYIKCKPDTVHISNTVFRENTARLDALKIKHDTLVIKLAKAEQDRDIKEITIKSDNEKIRSLTTILVILSALLFGATVFAFRRK